MTEPLTVGVTEKTVAKTPSSVGVAGLYCPLCAAPVEHHVGVIDEPVLTGRGVRRGKRLGSFDLCTACEWGQEAR